MVLMSGFFSFLLVPGLTLLVQYIYSRTYLNGELAEVLLRVTCSAAAGCCAGFRRLWQRLLWGVCVCGGGCFCLWHWRW